MIKALKRVWQTGCGVVAVLLLTVAGGNAQTTIIHADFAQADWDTHYLNGTSYGLSTNLPGGNWVWGAGWNWGSPFSAQWDTAGAANLVEEKTAMGVSISSAGSYTKPSKVRITAEIFFPEARGSDTAGVGFWSAMPDRDDSKSSTENFTGLVVDQVAGTVQVYAGGSPSGGTVSVGAISVGVRYIVSYMVDVSAGSLSEVTFDGNPVSGLSSTAFTDAATSFAGVLSGGGSRMKFFNLLLTDVPAHGTFVTIQ